MGVGAGEVAGGDDLPAFGDLVEFGAEGPAVGGWFAGVGGVAALEFHAAGVVADGLDAGDFVCGELEIWECGEFADFILDGFCGGAGLLDHGGYDGVDGVVGEVPEAGELEGGEVVLLCDGVYAL
jgi:hypothetical protein